MNDYIGFISLGLLIIIQISLFAYGYGKISHAVQVNGVRTDKLEIAVDKLKDKVTRLEAAVSSMK